jgi:hypothetical protein
LNIQTEKSRGWQKGEEKMASEEQKKQNLIRMKNLMIEGMAKALWDLFGESANATMIDVGKDILEIMENEMGLEVAGEDPKDVMTEIGRIFVDEFGYIESFSVEQNGNEITLKVDKCIGWNLTQAILKTGVDVPFTCPIMNVGQASLMRLGKPAHKKIEPRPDVRGSAITFIIEQ